MQLSNVRALVTGGAQGMGLTFTQQLAAAGARVAFCDVQADKVAAVSEALGVPGFVADVSSEEAVTQLLADAADALGSVNVLVNNAGIIRDGLLVKQDRETGAVRVLSKAKWDQVLAVNLTGPFLCTRAFAEQAIVREVGPGVVVNITSISRHGNRGQSNYAAAKAALAADTVVWAKELARHGLRVGAVAPGFIETPMVASMPPEARAKAVQPIPLKRLGQPEEIWEALRFIVACDYFTGRVVDVDGGLRL